MSTPIQPVAYTQCITNMYDDPAITGDLLLIGLYWARAVHLGTPSLNNLGRSTAHAIYGRAVHGPHLAATNHSHPRISTTGTRRVWDVIRSDIRRYTPDTSRAARCQRPIRRTPEQIEQLGEICGRPTSGEAYRALFVDPVDGTRHSIGCCASQRCTTWWQALRTKNQAEISEHRPPEPVANTGGILALHLSELDWERIYQALDPTWISLPESEPWRPPTLTVVVDLDHEDSADVPRPVLSVVRGGWR